MKMGIRSVALLYYSAHSAFNQLTNSWTSMPHCIDQNKEFANYCEYQYIFLLLAYVYKYSKPTIITNYNYFQSNAIYAFNV